MLLISTVHAETFPRYLDTVHSLSRSASFHATRFFPFATNCSQQGLCSTRGGYLQRHTTVRLTQSATTYDSQHIMLFNETHHFCIPDWCSSPLCLDLPSRLLINILDSRRSRGCWWEAVKVYPDMSVNHCLRIDNCQGCWIRNWEPFRKSITQWMSDSAWYRQKKTARSTRPMFHSRQSAQRHIYLTDRITTDWSSTRGVLHTELVIG